MRHMLRQRTARRLLATSTAGSLADWTLFAALVALVSHRTGGSVFAVAIVAAARLLPSIVLGPLVAGRAGRGGVGRMLAAADAARGLVIVVLPFAVGLWPLVTAVLALELAAALSAAARESAVSATVEPVRYAPFNTATAIAGYGMLPLGGLVAAGLDAVGPAAAFVVAGAVHLADAAVVLGTPELRQLPATRSAHRSRSGRAGALDGLRAVARPGSLRDIVAAAAIGVVAIALLFSVGTAVATSLLGGPGRYGLLLGLLGGGALVGTRVVAAGASAASGLLVAAVGSGLLLFATVVVAGVAASTSAVAGTVAVGLGASIAYVDTQSRLQHAARAPEEFAAAFAVLKVGTLLAVATAPALHAAGGTRLVAVAMTTAATVGTIWYARRVEGRGVATVVLTTLARPLLRAAVVIRTVGELPVGGAVLVSTHPSYLDGPAVMAVSDRIRPVARPQQRPLVRIALAWSGAVLVGREAIAGGLDHLRRGGLLWLAPEGGLTGVALGAGRTGAARMAAAAGAPVVPTALRHVDRGSSSGAVGPVGTVGPRLRRWRPWRRPRLVVDFGIPLTVADGEDPRHATDRIMAALSAHSGVPLMPVPAAGQVQDGRGAHASHVTDVAVRIRSAVAMPAGQPLAAGGGRVRG